VISSLVARSSAAVLFAAGLALLFAPEQMLGAVTPTMPTQAYWLGQLLAAAWLGVAALNWLQRGVVMGGIYARPLVYTNFVLWFVSAMSMVRVVLAPAPTMATWLFAVVTSVFAVVYAALLFRGPFDALPSKG
jgi:hypothetical protein